VSLIQGRLGSLVGRSSGYIESLPVEVKRRVAGLKGIQKEHSKLEAEFQEEVLQLEKKYFAKFTPLYQQRSAIVNGQTEPTEDQVKAGEEAQEDQEAQENEEAEGAAVKEEKPTGIKGIPEFWLSAMKNQISFAEMITDRDEGALKSLTDIRMEYLDKPGFRLIFEFAENEYFTNKTITKTYYYQNENGYGGDFIYDHAEGDKIDWKPGKDLTVRIEQKKQRNKSKCSKRGYWRAHTNKLSYQANSHRQEDCPYRVLLQLLLASQAPYGGRRRRCFRHRGSSGARLPAW
jgi:nucleosome assembly protein 1-like 1